MKDWFYQVLDDKGGVLARGKIRASTLARALKTMADMGEVPDDAVSIVVGVEGEVKP